MRPSRRAAATFFVDLGLPDAEDELARAALAREIGAVIRTRELVGKGWPVEALSPMVDDEALAVEALPPAGTGAGLVRRAEDAAHGRQLTA